MAHEHVYWNGGHTDGGYNDESYSTNNGPRAENWNKGAGNGHPDHVCRPVIVDALGRKRPIVCFKPSGNTEIYITKTIVEPFRTPAVTEYKYSSPGRVVDEHKYSYPVRVEEYKHSPPGRVVGDHKYSYLARVEEYKHSPPGRVLDENKYSYPVRVEEYNHSSPGWVVDEHKHSHPVRVEEYKHSSPANRCGRPSSPVHGRPPRVEEFITKIQTGVSELPRPGPLTAMNWRQPHNSSKAPNGTSGYGDYSDYSEDDYWNKPSCNILTRSDSFNDDHYRRNDGTKEPTITKSNGWGRANHAEWATAPDSNLTRPTSDIGAAAEILKEAAMRSSGQHVRFITPASTVPEYREIIDSREAARRYGNFKATSRPYSTGGTTIDNKTAEQKYKGPKV